MFFFSFFRELQKNSRELAGLIIINKCLPRLALCEMLSQCTSAALAVRWLKHKPLASSAISCRVKTASNMTVLLPPCLHCQRWLPRRRLPCVSEKYSHPLLQAWLTTKLHKNNPCCSNTQPWHREAGPDDKIVIIVIIRSLQWKQVGVNKLTLEFINLKGNSPATGWKVSRPAGETEQYQIKLQNRPD